MCLETPRLNGTWAGEERTAARRGKRGLQGQGGEVSPPHSSVVAPMPAQFHHGFLVGMDSKWVSSHVLGGGVGGEEKGSFPQNPFTPKEL